MKVKKLPETALVSSNGDHIPIFDFDSIVHVGDYFVASSGFDSWAKNHNKKDEIGLD